MIFLDELDKSTAPASARMCFEFYLAGSSASYRGIIHESPAISTFLHLGKPKGSSRGSKIVPNCLAKSIACSRFTAVGGCRFSFVDAMG